MGAKESIDIIRDSSEEIISEDELTDLLEQDENPVAYEGFEPSGLAHIAFGLYRPLIIQEHIDAGIDFKILLADYMAEKNGRLDGDPAKIRESGEYFVEVLEASELDLDDVDILWQSDIVEDPEYWNIATEVATNHSLNRAERTLPKEDRNHAKNPFDTFYPSMQCADMFYLDADISQMAMDQRKVNMLAREVAPRIDRDKPVAIHGKFLPSLSGPEHKMDKSISGTSIYVHDSSEEIEEKIHSAYCPPAKSDNNPILEYAEEIIFRANDELFIPREQKYGGDLLVESYEELGDVYVSGGLHPEDLKKGVSKSLDELISPIRSHFNQSESAEELYENVLNH